MLSPIDNYFAQQAESTKSCLQFLRMHLLQLNEHVTEAWKYGMPFFCYDKKMFCYLWIHKKYHQPYIGIVNGHQVNHPDLLLEKRAKMKILLLDASKDLSIETIDTILHLALANYK